MMEERQIGAGEETSGDIAVIEEQPQAIRQMVEGEISMQVATAKRYPRSLAKFKSKLSEMVRLNKDVAESCYYILRRSGKPIIGPSVRMAEMAVAAYGNCRVAGRIISTDHDNVTLEGVAFDMENNTAWYVQTVRRLLDSKGNRYSDDMVITSTNAGVSIVVRNAALRMIPRALIDEALADAKAVVAGSMKDLAGARRGALKKCVELGISNERMFAFLEVGGEEDMTVTHIVELSGALNAIADGQATVAEVFPAATGNGSEAAGRRTFGRKKAEPPATEKPAPSGVVSAPDPNRPSQMSAPQSSIFWRKAEEISGTRSKAVVAVQLAIDALVKEQTISTNVKGWQDVSDKDSEFVLAALERLAKKE
jgi:hypothetical protein